MLELRYSEYYALGPKSVMIYIRIIQKHINDVWHT